MVLVLQTLLFECSEILCLLKFQVQSKPCLFKSS